MSSAWSYSALSAYETCPQKYYHERVLKDLPQLPSAQADAGTDSHKAFELYLLEEQPLPAHLSQHKKTLESIRNKVNGNNILLLPEYRMAVTIDMEPVDFWSDDAWCRGVADLALIGKTNAAAFDWKFGKPHDNPDQLALMALLIMCHWPNVAYVRTAFYWAQRRRLSQGLYSTNDKLRLYNEFKSRSERMLLDLKYAPRRNGLCKRWCQVKSCPYNGA